MNTEKIKKKSDIDANIPSKLRFLVLSNINLFRWNIFSRPLNSMKKRRLSENVYDDRKAFAKIMKDIESKGCII